MTWKITTFDTLPSTQDTAIAAAQFQAPGRTAVIAARQTAGRGRNSRVWTAPEGNLNVSLLLRPGPIAPSPAQWSLMAGVALHGAVTAFLPVPGALALKWPNDLLLHGAKLAGILVDSALNPAGLLDWVVIGIGVNLAQAPALPDRAATCLAQHGRTVAPAELASGVMAALDHWTAQDLPTIRAAWLARAHPPGTRLRVQAGEHVIEGEFDTLAEDGRLILRGRAPIPAGEVFLEAPHAAGG